jgi:molybdopterin synthase sulfur carrier subunit
LARIAFTRHLEAVGPTDPVVAQGATLGEALEALAADYPRLSSYVLDDQGRVRKHIAIFVDGSLHPRETALSLPMSGVGEIYVFQALSGG